MPSVVCFSRASIMFCIIALLSVPAAPVQAAPAVLRVGAYENPPKVTIDENGNISGIFGEVIREIAEQENWQIEVVPCSWSTCLQMLATGEIHLMPDVAMTDNRNNTFSFHEIPVLHSWSQLYAKSSGVVSNLLDLDGMRVAVLRDSVQSQYLANLVKNFGISVQFEPVGSFDEGFAALLADRVDLVAVNHLYGDQRARELGMKVTPVMFQPSRLFYAATPEPELNEVLTIIDRWLAAWRVEANSPYVQIMQRWGAYAPAEQQKLPPWLLPSLVALLAFAVLVVVLLRHQVVRKSRALLETEQRSNIILNSIEAYIFIKDTQLKYRYANKQVCELLGESEESIIGKSDFDLFDEVTAEYLRDNDLRVIEQGQRLVDEEHNTTREGETRQFLSVKIPLRDANDQIYALCGISTDITEHVRIQEQLNQLAYYDGITGLANRKLLIQQLDHALASYRRTGFEGAVLAVDLIDYTLVNDSLGHPVGDRLLRSIAERLEQQIADTDFAARLGSDDFVVVLEDLGPDRNEAILTARRFANKLVEVIQEPIDLGIRSHTTAACIGITMFSDCDDGAAEMVKNADLALSAAKRSGSGAIRMFNPEMQQSINRRLHLEAALRSAIGERKLELYLQPQVNSENQVTGGELLLRWEDEAFGQVPPSEFIPVAESSGLIVPLGNWVIEQACALLQQWSGEPRLKELQVAINISPRQFRQPAFVDYVASCLQRYAVPSGRLELEITENMLIENVDITIERMSKLGHLGVRFSLDDFGTGYASLAYLKRLPIYQLKIDQSFVRDVLTDINDAVIVETIVGLGDSLGLEVIAEGVETAGQERGLRELGCLKFQGFLYGRPQPIAYWVERFKKSLQVTADEA